LNFFLVADKTGPIQQKLSEVNLEEQEKQDFSYADCPNIFAWSTTIVLDPN